MTLFHLIAIFLYFKRKFQLFIVFFLYISIFILLCKIYPLFKKKGADTGFLRFIRQSVSFDRFHPGLILVFFREQSVFCYILVRLFSLSTS